MGINGGKPMLLKTLKDRIPLQGDPNKKFIIDR
jgi:hypothetical protein